MLLESYAQEVGSTLGALEAIARSTEREVRLPAGPLLGQMTKMDKRRYPILQMRAYMFFRLPWAVLRPPVDIY